MADKQASTLAVLMFQGEGAAEALYKEIEQMEKEKLVVVEDAVILERAPQPAAAPAPTSSMETMHMAPAQRAHDAAITVKQTRGKKGKYAAIGGGIGLLAAAILGGPIGLVAVASAGVGAVAAALKDFGIDDTTVDTIKQSLQPNTSALLVLGHANDREAFLAKLRTFDAQVVMTSLDPEVERELVARLAG